VSAARADGVVNCTCATHALAPLTVTHVIDQVCQHCLSEDLTDSDIKIGGVKYHAHPKFPSVSIEASHAVWRTQIVLHVSLYQGRVSLGAMSIAGARPGFSFGSRLSVWAENSATVRAAVRRVSGFVDAVAAEE
jgi:hypothetical protein